MWGAIAATAAANKAASIGVGLSVLLGTAGTAEVSGIGPSVSELVQSSPPQQASTEPMADIDEEHHENEEAAVSAGTDDLNASAEEETADADHAANDREHFAVATDDGPGNLVWHQKQGEFHLRGILVLDGDGVAIRTAGPDGVTTDLPLDVDLVSVHIPGGVAKHAESEEPATLATYLGHLVRASGECADAPALESGLVCTVRELRLLGNAGQDRDEDESAQVAHQPDSDIGDDGDEGDANELEDERHGREDGDGRSQGNGHKPEHAGGPKHNDDSSG